MKFTLDWLKDHLETTADANGIADALNMIGLEVEAIEDFGARLKDFVVAYVVSAEKHPNADKLRVCRVDAGTGEIIDVVCGAPNAVTGMKSVFAFPGTYIPGKDVVLQKGVIRGAASNGMLCSAMELELSEDHEGIIRLPDDAPVGVRYVDYAGLTGAVIDVAITPNRGDATGVLGIARDLAAFGLGTLKDFSIAPQPSPGGKSPVGVTLKFDGDPSCKMFAGRLITGVKNGPSPQWLQDRLRAIGLRPISTLVDITNLVTHDRARPLHVFDADKLTGNIQARMASAGETLAALDGKTYALDETMCVIADDSGALGIGGIIGGEPTGCTDDTVNVFVECAWFEPGSIAATGRKLGINSDARYRFERTVDPESVRPGIELATSLITELCGGTAHEVVVAGHGPRTQERLALPGRRPALVVLLVRREGAHERPVASLRAQPGVHLERRFGTHRPEQAADPGCHRQGLGLGTLRVGARQRLVHEEDVGVGAVAELAPAQAAHRDHRVARQRPVGPVPHLVLGDAQGTREHHVGGRRQGVSGGDHRAAPEHLGHRGARHLPPTQRPQQGGRVLGVLLAGQQRVDLGRQARTVPRRELGVVVEPRDGLGRAGQGVRHVAGGGEQPGESVRGDPRVAQQLEVPVRGPQLVGQTAERQEAGVGVRTVGEPAEQHRQELPLDRGAAADPLGQRGDVPQGPGRVAVADRRQPCAGGLRREAHVLAGQARGGGEQRPVEELLVEVPDVALDRPPPLHHGLRTTGAHAHGPGQTPQLRLAGRHEVGAPQPVQLDAVLEHAQQPVADREPRSVVPPHVAARGEGRERVERGGAPDRLIGPSVHELEQLHGELHVPQAADAELELAVGLLGGAVLDDPAVHLVHSDARLVDAEGAPLGDALDRLALVVGTSLASQESIPAAFAVLALAPDDAWLAVRAGASLGGDADTIGAIAGAIAGAVHGTAPWTGGPANTVDAVGATRLGVDSLGLPAIADALVALRHRSAHEAAGG